MDRQVFVVTGGNGYIGSHMCKLLVEQGHTVHVIDNYSTSPSEPVHSYGSFHHLDISNEEMVTSLFKSIQPAAIFHFAARAQVNESENDPILYYEENVVKTISLLKSAMNAGVRKFIFSSTCATFGVPKTETLSESNEQNPINTYGLTKKIMEMTMRDLAAKGLIDVIAFRYFNAAGSSPDVEIGENHDPETHIIPNLCKAFLGGSEGTFYLFGDQFPTPDGTCVRDYIHVSDLAKVHYDGFRYLEKHSGFHDFNLGSETGSSNKEVIETFKEVSGSDLKVVIEGARAGDPPRLVGDSTKAKRELNFAPQFSLRDSISHTLAWFKKKAN